ncbi:chitin deacetylase 1 isoform X2 [Bombus affinis]|uniref:Chitin deacetylase 1 isoform X2 n=1 Tax=Bombus terrestris TaxID=30195 RepID=A0A9B7CXU5_BOMTE|nr:chitin deacetylase 1 isoform X2 [Bombus terrestris]XP_050580778.1 chitin deacetylase 1 isoform X2 [Bombus affinis]
MTATTTTAAAATMSPKFLFLLGSLFLFAGTQVRAQDDEGADGIDANAEELCQDRPGDEYFRLNVEGDCRDVVRCTKSGLKQITCPSGLAFDLDKQTCDWKGKVTNCDKLEKPRKVLPILRTDEPVCPEGKLSCGNGECVDKELFCNGKPDCKDESDENACTVETDPNRAPDCDPTQCVLPDCYCSADGTRIPGNIEPSQVPQMITITFNGAVNVDNIDLYEEIFNGQRQNPNGCQIRGTFFVSHKYTNYSAVQDLHRRGHEIAVFSLTHKDDPQYWTQGTYDDWLAEMAGARLIIERFANITDGSIIGMRAPYLRVGGNKQFEMMADQFFVYDASITASLGRVPIWPYTLYFRMPHKCNGNGGNCPSRSHPVWEMVMNELDRRDDPTFDESLPGCHMVDSCSNIQTGEQFARLLRHNFNRHFNSNRAPLGLHFHASWLKSKKEYREELIKFIEEMLARSDVYFVTMVQVIKWMQTPTELSALRDFQDWKETCDEKGQPYCSLPNACPLTTRELPGETLRLFTCMECPNYYPWLLDPTGDGFTANK